MVNHVDIVSRRIASGNNVESTIIVYFRIVEGGDCSIYYVYCCSILFVIMRKEYQCTIAVKFDSYTVCFMIGILSLLRRLYISTSS